MVSHEAVKTMEYYIVSHCVYYAITSSISYKNSPKVEFPGKSPLMALSAKVVNVVQF